MKPYRGMHLAAAVLLAALPFAGCGDADDYAESGTITLTSDLSSVEVKKEVVFTVVSDPKVPTTATASAAPGKVILDECVMALEYRADGGGVNTSWTSIPGSGPTRVWKLTPREIGTLNVLARGRCADSNEEWEYSATVQVAVTDKTLPEVTTLTLTANPSSVEVNKPVTFNLGAVVTNPSNAEKCTLNLSYQYSGAGLSLTTVSPAYVGQFILTPTRKGTLTVTAHGWCSENASDAIQTTTTVTVTDEILPIVTGVTVTVTPTTVVGGNPVVFTVSVTKETACTLRVNTVVNGNTYSNYTNPAWSTTSGGTYSLPTFATVSTTSLVIASEAYCTENSTARVAATATVSVTP